MTQDDTWHDCDRVIYLIGLSEELSLTQSRFIETELPFVESIVEGDVTAWFVQVERSLFEGSQAEANLADVTWLTPRILAHQNALEQLGSVTAIHPMTFGTLFSSQERLRSFMCLNATALIDYFGSMHGMQEWGIKCIVSWAAAVKAYHRTHPGGGQEQSSTGVNYLRQQKQIRERDLCVREWIGQDLAVIDRQLNTFAKASCQRRIQSAGMSKDEECLASIALLIEHSNVPSLLQWTDSFNADSGLAHGVVKLEVTGPWPLFSFCPDLAQPMAEVPIAELV